MKTRTSLILCVVAVLAFVAVQSAQASVIDWKSVSGDTAWATGTNWDGNTAPADSTATDIARFNKTSYAFQPNSGTRSIAGIQIGDGTTAAAAVTISSTTLTIGGSGVVMNAGVAGDVTFAPTGKITLGANQSFTNNSAKALIVNSPITSSGYTLTLDGSGGVNFKGTHANLLNGLYVTNGRLFGGSTGDNMFGKGTIYLGGTGGSNSATIDPTGSASHVDAPIVVQSGSSGTRTITSSAQNVSFTGNITLNGDLTVDSTYSGGNKTTTVSGAISGTGNLTKGAGAGKVILSGTNTYTGTTTVSNSTLQIGNAGTTGSLSPSSAITNNAKLVFNRTDTITQGTDFASVISGTGAVTQAGSGSLVFSGTNLYTGATAVDAGTLVVNGSIATSSGVTVAALATLKGNGTVPGVTVGNTGTVAPGTSIGTLHVVGNVNFSAGGILDIEVDATTADLLAITGTGNLILGGSSALNVTGIPVLSEYTIATYTGSLTGTFTTETLPGGYFVDYSQAGKIVLLPEPATMALLGLGGLGLILGRKRR